MLRGVLLSVGVLVVMMVSTVTCQDSLTCLAEMIPAEAKVFQDCTSIIKTEGQDKFCENDTCTNYLSCITLTEHNTDCKMRPDLKCLFEEAAVPQLTDCQGIRADNLTAYCFNQSCYFVEKSYDSCGFDLYGCNPVRSACNDVLSGQQIVSRINMLSSAACAESATGMTKAGPVLVMVVTVAALFANMKFVH